MSIFKEETQASMINQRLELKVEGKGGKNKLEIIQKGILNNVLAFYDNCYCTCGRVITLY